MLKEANTASDSIKLYSKIAKITTLIDPNQSVLISEKLLHLSVINSNMQGVATAYDLLGISYVLQSNYDKALNSLNKALKIAKDHKFNTTVASIYNHLGIIQRHNSEHRRALKYYEKSIAISKKLNNTLQTAECLMNMAIVYISIKDYDTAMEYLNDALVLCEKSKDAYGIITIKKNIALIKALNKNYEESLHMMQEVYAYEDSVGYTFRKLHTAMNIGGIYYHSDDLLKAKNQFEYSLSLLDKTNNDIIRKECYSGLSKIYRQLGDVDQGIKYAEKAYAIMKKYTISELSIHIVESLSDLYEEKKDYKSALAFSRIKDMFEDSLKLHEKKFDFSKERSRLRIKNYTLKKERELANIKAEKARHLTIGGFIFFIVVIVLLYYSKIKLARINKKLIFSNETKSNFLTKMTHEIKTPLNAIIGYTDLLLNFNNLTEVQRRYINTIKSSGDSLLAMAEDIFDFNRFEKDKIKLYPKPTDLKALFAEVFEMFQLTSKTKNIQFKLNVSEDIPKTLLIDNLKLRRVLYSLLENAIKYTSSGTVTLNAKLINKLEKKSEIQISIVDTGHGIKLENQQKIFDEFYQEESDYTREVIGIGLGLSLSSKIVNLLGGTLEVKSKPDKGSEFYFTLNFDHGTEIEEKTEKDNSANEVENKVFKVLVIEDNKINLLLTKKLLLSLYKNVVLSEAFDGKMGVEVYEKEKPDIVLMDIQMPILNGLEATKIIRKNYSATIPIIALSAGSAKENLEKSLEAGINDYLEKPINLKKLREVLYTYILNI